MTFALRRFVFTTHVTSSVGWVGAVLVFLALAIIGLTSPHEATVRGAYLVMAPAAWFVLVPLAHASLLTGVAISLGTPWGLFHHYWVVSKLVITLVATVVLLIYMDTFRQMAGAAADPVLELRLVRNPSPMVHAILALILLLVAMALAIYKPFGMTAHGRNQNARRRALSSAVLPETVVSEDGTGTSFWLYATTALVLAAILAFVIVHLLSGGIAHH
jgi:hypothetical protein